MQRNQTSPGADTMRLRRIRLVSYAVLPRTPITKNTLPMSVLCFRRAKFEWSAQFNPGRPAPAAIKICWSSAIQRERLFRCDYRQCAVTGAGTKAALQQALCSLETETDCTRAGRQPNRRLHSPVTTAPDARKRLRGRAVSFGVRGAECLR